MTTKTAITVNRPREEVQRLWTGSEPVTFKDAPGDRGTEIHVEVASRGLGGAKLAKVRDELRHFKQLIETGEVPRSDSVPEGERVERKFKQRPAQPLSDDELQEVGAR
jgi:uncharacterized membrane protein